MSGSDVMIGILIGAAAFFLVFLGFCLGQDSVALDCKHFEKFRADKVTYECRPAK